METRHNEQTLEMTVKDKKASRLIGDASFGKSSKSGYITKILEDSRKPIDVCPKKLFQDHGY